MVSGLRELGLTEYESKVYEVLLRLKSATAGQIAKESKVPHGKTYESLHNLAEKGLITILAVEPKLFKLVEPKVGIKNFIERRAAALEESGKAVIDSIKEIKIPSEKAVEKLEVRAGAKSQFEIGAQMSESAKKQILVISRGEKIPHALLQKVKEQIKKGIDYRLIVYDPSNKEWIEKFKSIGMKVRFLEQENLLCQLKTKKKLCWL